MKIGLVYTSTTPELISVVEAEVKKQIGEEAELIRREDPTILADIREAGYVTAAPAARLVKLYMDVVEEGADAVLNLCSSVGEAADAVQDLARYLGVPIVRVDEEMCREAVRLGRNIAIMATLPTTLAPTRNTVLRVAREMGKRVELTEVLVDGGFGLDQEQFKELMARKAKEVADTADVLLFAQGSMAYCEEYIAGLYQKPVLSSPGFGAKALKAALVGKGLCREDRS